MEGQEIEDQEEFAQESARKLPADYFYPEDWKHKELPDSEITNALAKFHWCAGLDVYKKNNLAFLSSDEIIFAVGYTYHIYNIQTEVRQIFFSRDGFGIGAIAVHPQRTYFAIGEKGKWPNVYIYEYPSMRLYRVLRKGTETAYSTISWSQSGSKLATVGSNPDYLLTVWDWLQERVILKCKAFGQEVYRVTFSPTYEEQITTSGTAHIRFWKMAKTFTGLKLQGDIGKFGQVELSDITGYAELPDGKVLSGSEYGNLLLWEGALIKAYFTLPDGTPSHGGAVEVVMLQGDDFLSAGTDGYIRWWNFDEVDQAEPDEGLEYQLAFKREVYIGDGAQIVSLIQGDDFWVALDKRGMMWKLADDWKQQDKFMDFHSGKIADFVVSPDHNVAITIGSDSRLKVWDFISQQELYSQQFSGKGKCISWAPSTKANQGRMIAAGFGNGLIRILQLDKESFKLLGAWKAHDASIKKCLFSRCGRHLITIGKDNTVFFFDIKDDDSLEPVCITPIDSKINDISWHQSSDKLILALESGQVCELSRPEPSQLDTSHSYEVQLEEKRWTMKMMEFQIKEDDEEDFFLMPPRRPGEKDDKDKEWPPQSIASVRYLDTDKFIVASKGEYIGYIYVCQFHEERPIQAIPTSETLVTHITLSKNFIVTSHIDGSFEIRIHDENEKFLKKRPHDSQTKLVKADLSYNENYLISVGNDGTLFVCELFPQQIQEASTMSIAPEVPQDPKFELGASTMGLDNDLGLRVVTEDIQDTSIYSIQMDKLRTDEDRKKELAELKKQKKREEIQALRKEFEDLMKENQEAEEKYRLNDEELRVDPEFYSMLEERNRILIEEVHKEIAWDKAYQQLALEKYQKYFLDEVAVQRFSVFGLQTHEKVNSFRVVNPSEFLKSNIDEITQLMEEESRGKGAGSETESVVSPGKFSQFTIEQSEQNADETKAEFKINMQTGIAKQNDDKKVSRTQELMEKRTKAREERKKIKEQHLRNKPDQNKYDMEDDRRIQIALETMGDFQLKTSPDYVVPENQCINASKKRRQMFLLMESAYNLKMDFNGRLLALRENKQRLIEWIKKHNERIEEINEELTIKESLFQPEFLDDEWPENQYIVDDKDIEQFAKIKAKRNVKVQISEYGGAAVEEQAEEEQEHNYEESPRYDDSPKRNRAPMSEAEREFQEHKNLKLLNEKKALQSDIHKRVMQFDEALEQQIEQKHLLECDLKQIEMKLLTYYYELQKLDDLEPQDNKLNDRMLKLSQEKAKLMNDINEITQQYESHKLEAEKITKQQDEIYQKFNQIVEETDPYYDYLQTVLDKKLKRSKKRKKSDASDEDDDDEDDDDSQMSDSYDDSDDESDQEEELCPTDCDMNKFEEVQNLREERQNLADLALHKAQIMQDLKRRTEDIEKKDKRTENEILKTRQEIQEFQREKMKQLNQIYVALMLSQDQIKIIDNDLLPVDLSESVLFTINEREKLKLRIDELKVEKEEAREERKKYAKQSHDESKEINLLKKKRDEAKQKFDAIQTLKFGQQIKLDNLKHAAPSEELAEKKNKFSKQERDAIKSIERQKVQLANTRKDLHKVTEISTMLIKERTKVLKEIIEFNKLLDFGNQDMYKDEDDNERDKIVEERNKLKELLDVQRREIETLKTEINLFRRKGGHIYTKITANRRANIE